MGYYFFSFGKNKIMGHFSGYFEGAKTFLTPNCPERSKGQFRGPLDILPAFSKSAVL
jgi:hypothetical protein